jgi:hypothetical protein
MSPELLVTLLRGTWLTLAGMILCSRIAFQAAGPVRMRAFLDTWKASTTKRVWGGAALLWGVVLLVVAVQVAAQLSPIDAALLAPLVVVLVGDGLLNFLPGTFSQFKERMQDAWVRRQRDPRQAGDAALFGTVNLILAAASLVVAAIAVLYQPISLGTILAALVAALLLTAALVAGAVREGRGATPPSI